MASDGTATILRFLTDFADQAVVLPVVLVVAGALGVQRRWRAAASWSAVVLVVLGTVAALKVLGYACAWRFPAAALWRSPSGHVASAALICGGLAGLAATGSQRRRAGVALVSACIAGLGIGLTRFLLGAHTVEEVGLGLAIGAAGAVAFPLLAGPAARRNWPILAGAALVAVLLHGHRLQAEQALGGRWSRAAQHWISPCARLGGAAQP